MFKKKKKGAPLSEGGAGANNGRGCLILFGGVFLLVGLGVMAFGSAIPMYKVTRATQWVETPCTIVSSTVESHSSDDGTTYSIEIAYQYTFDGQSYSSDQYDFLDMSSSGRSRKEAVVAKYPAGSERVCYVNPSSPDESVINRGLQWSYFFIGAFGSIFALVGGAIIWGSARSGKSDRGKLKSEWRAEDGPVDNAAPVVMQPGGARIGAFVLITIFALIWNGIVGAVILNGDAKGMEALFLVPFVLVGIGVIAAAIYALLGVFNPSFIVTITPGRPYPGQTVTVEWRCNGAVRRIKKLTLSIRGQETATYRRGTDTVTDKATFSESVLLETNDPQDMLEGSHEFSLPITTMHSFEAPNNKIIWDIQVEGEIPRWPDVKDEYVFTVIPYPPESL